MLGKRERERRRPYPVGRALVGRRGDNRETVPVLTRFDRPPYGLNLAATLANQAQDHMIRLGLRCELFHQAGFADPACGNDPDALASPQSEQAIDCLDARYRDGRRRRSLERRGNDTLQWVAGGGPKGIPAVDLLSERIDRPSGKCVANRDRASLAEGHHARAERNGASGIERT